MPALKYLLVDGYNIIHRLPELKALLDGGPASGLEAARQRLALLISTWRQSRPGVECRIVFDGDHKYTSGRPLSLAGIPAVFTRTSHGADAEIIRLVREHRGPKAEITVVSDDNSIRNSCRAHGAALESSSFIRTAKSRPAQFGRPQAGPVSSGKGLSGKAAADVTAELKKKFGI